MEVKKIDKKGWSPHNIFKEWERNRIWPVIYGRLVVNLNLKKLLDKIEPLDALQWMGVISAACVLVLIVSWMQRYEK